MDASGQWLYDDFADYYDGDNCTRWSGRVTASNAVFMRLYGDLPYVPFRAWTRVKDKNTGQLLLDWEIETY